MGKWIVLLVIAFVALAIVGFLIDAVQAVIGFGVFVLIAVFAFQYLRRRAGRGSPPARRTGD